MSKSSTELLGSFITEYSVKNKDGADIPVYSVSNDKGFCRDYFSKDVSSKDKSSYKIVPRGCFAYNPSRINVGSIAWQNKEDAVIVSPLYVVFSTRGLNNDFLMYYLKSNALMSYIKIYSAGSVRNNLRFKTLSSFPVKVPSLEQQARIVAELDCLTGIIEKKKQQLEELDKLAQSIFYDMFGDPISNEKGWEVKKLKDVSTLLNGRAYKQDELLPEGKYKVLRVGNFFTNGDYYYSNLELDDDKYCDTGDLLFAWSASFGAFIWDGGKVIYHYHIWKVLYDDKFLNLLYYKYLLNTMTSSFMKDVHGIGMVHLTKAGMEQYSLPIPPLDLQNEFAQKIKAIEKQKELVKRSIVETETLFNSRMDYWFN